MEVVDEGGFNFFSMQQTASPRRNPFRTIDGLSHVIGTHVRSDSGSKKVNAVYVADIDMISDFFFEERNLGNLDIEFDNVTFMLNAADTLIGGESFIDLRSRRARHRTLKRVEAQKRQFLEQANKAEQEADKEAEEQLATRRNQLKKRAEEIEKDENLDPIAKRKCCNRRSRPSNND